MRRGAPHFVSQAPQKRLNIVSETLKIARYCLTMGGGNAEFGREIKVMRRKPANFRRQVPSVSKRVVEKRRLSV
jgi:hypothetical protein